MSQTAYIDQLLKAEQAANETIAKAHKQRYDSKGYRQNKLKQAKQQAELQVTKYREQRQKQFNSLKQRKQDKIFEKSLQDQTKKQIIQIQNDFKQNKDKVIQMLINKVLQVDLSIPSSVRQKFAKKQNRK